LLRVYLDDVRRDLKAQGLLAAGANEGTTAADIRTGDGVDNLESKALAILVQHPDWGPSKIAEKVGCSRGHLYRMKQFQRARAALKQGKHELPLGSKTLEHEVEAWDAEDQDEGENNL
jgi:hypothetical protein